jgi:membrane protein implicated in regulation of membrane protease activity
MGGAIAVVSVIIGLLCYWTFHWSGVLSAIVGVVVATLIVAIFKATFSGFGGKNKAQTSTPPEDNNSTNSTPNE